MKNSSTHYTWTADSKISFSWSLTRPSPPFVLRSPLMSTLSNSGGDDCVSSEGWKSDDSSIIFGGPSTRGEGVIAIRNDVLCVGGLGVRQWHGLFVALRTFETSIELCIQLWNQFQQECFYRGLCYKQLVSDNIQRKHTIIHLRCAVWPQNTASEEERVQLVLTIFYGICGCFVLYFNFVSVWWFVITDDDENDYLGSNENNAMTVFILFVKKCSRKVSAMLLIFVCGERNDTHIFERIRNLTGYYGGLCIG